MAKKKPRPLSRRQQRRLRIKQILFIGFALLVIASFLVGLVA